MHSVLSLTSSHTNKLLFPENDYLFIFCVVLYTIGRERDLFCRVVHRASMRSLSEPPVLVGHIVVFHVIGEVLLGDVTEFQPFLQFFYAVTEVFFCFTIR